MIRLGLGLVLLLCVPLALQVTPLEVMKLKTFDYLVEKQEPSGYFTILDITEDDVRNEGGWPIPRQRLAEINDKLFFFFFSCRGTKQKQTNFYNT